MLEWEVLSGGSINWPWLMAEIAKRGLTDRCGKAPTLGTARQTWYRVKDEMKKRHAASAPQRAPASSPPKPIAATPPVKSPPRSTFAFPTAKDR